MVTPSENLTLFCQKMLTSYTSYKSQSVIFRSTSVCTVTFLCVGIMTTMASDLLAYGWDIQDDTCI